MTTKQFNQALQIARNASIRFIDDNGKHMQDISIFDGFGLDGFKAVHCTMMQLAFLIRWQCISIFNGNIDHNAMQAIRSIGRNKFKVLE